MQFYGRTLQGLICCIVIKDTLQYLAFVLTEYYVDPHTHRVEASATSITLVLVLAVFTAGAAQRQKTKSGVCFVNESEWGSMQLCDLGTFVRLSLSRQQYIMQKHT